MKGTATPRKMQGTSGVFHANCDVGAYHTTTDERFYREFQAKIIRTVIHAPTPKDNELMEVGKIDVVHLTTKPLGSGSWAIGGITLDLNRTIIGSCRN